MAKLVVLITARLVEGHRVGEAWQQAGAPGVTFLEGYGLRGVQKATRSGEILSGMLSMLEILRENEETSLLLLSLVQDDTVVDQLITIAEGILGDLMVRDNGIIFVIDVERAVGIRPFDAHD